MADEPGAGSHRPRKRFGQHFLSDQYVVDCIVELIGAEPGETIIEIGPGSGVLTRPLVASGARITAIEVDRDLCQALRLEFAAATNFTLYNEDVLKFDFAGLETGARPWKIVGNLPYNISTPLIMRLLEYAGNCAEMTFMLQREVAERLAAAAGTQAYGRLSIMAQRRARIQTRLEVPAASFTPPPKVESSVVQLLPYATTCAARVEKCLDELVRQAFSQRRKTVARSLRDRVPKGLFADCGIDPGARPEVLSGQDFERLAKACLDAQR